jgi:hypothetical protein
MRQGSRRDFEAVGVMRIDARELRFDAIAGPGKTTTKKRASFPSQVGGEGSFSRGCEDAEGGGLKPLSHKALASFGNPRNSPFSHEESED